MLQVFRWVKNDFTATKQITVKSGDGFDNALRTFHEAAKRVPAYKDFLHKNKVNPANINTLDDFKTVPCITKENYLKKYPFKDLLWDGNTEDVRVISMSSGSSGQPFYWPRGMASIEQSVVLHERLFDQSFNTRKTETLVIVAFAMGTWIAGTYTTAAMAALANQGHRIVTITPGINKNDNVRILKELAPQFSQTILMGYPPFVKDVLDTATKEEVKLRSLNLHVVFAGENISERWRDYILRKIGADNELDVTANIYGTADAGFLGSETPLSIYARRVAVKDKDVFAELFSETSIIPTLVQYVPDLRFFEILDDSIIFTVNNSLPLVRYCIGDKGRLISHKEIIATLQRHKHSIPDRLLRWSSAPYIALYGREDVATTYYALNVYPENIKYGLEDPRLQDYITGKFVIKTEYDDDTQDQTLHLRVQMKESIEPSKTIEKLILEAVLKSLRKHNSEYNKLHQEMGEAADPIIHLVEYGSSDFDVKVKHRWVAKS